MKTKHTDATKKFAAILPVDLLQEWAEMISRWEQDKTKPNPYTHTEKGVIRYLLWSGYHANLHLASNMAEVRRRLAETDQQDAQGDLTFHGVPASVFVRNGLEIEEQQ